MVFYVLYVTSLIYMIISYLNTYMVYYVDHDYMLGNVREIKNITSKFLLSIKCVNYRELVSGV